MRSGPCMLTFHFRDPANTSLHISVSMSKADVVKFVKVKAKSPLKCNSWPIFICFVKIVMGKDSNRKSWILNTKEKHSGSSWNDCR